MTEAIGAGEPSKKSVPGFLRSLNTLNKRGRFGYDYLEAAIGWVTSEDPFEPRTSERWNSGLKRLVRVFKQNPNLVGRLDMMRPPESLLEKMSTVEERIEYLVEGLERTAVIRNKIKNRSFSCVIDNQPINFNYDLVHAGSGGTRVEATVVDNHTGALFRLGHLDFDIFSDTALRVNEVQTDASDRDILNFAELRKTYKGDINVYVAKLINRLKHLQRIIREKIQRDRLLIKNPILPQEPSIEELLIVSVRKNLIAQGLLRTDNDIEVLDAAETAWGNGYGAKVATHKALGRAIKQADYQLRNKTGLSEDDFYRLPTPEDIGYAVFQKIEDWQLIANLLLQRIPAERRPTAETVQQLLAKSSSKYDILDFLTKLTTDYQIQFYPYWSVLEICLKLGLPTVEKSQEKILISCLLNFLFYPKSLLDKKIHPDEN